MRKISFILLCPLFLNVMTFMKRFLYDSIFMFFISFMVFFISLYADSDKNQNSKKKWRLAALIVSYASVVLYICDTETISKLILVLAYAPAAAGAAVLIKYVLKSETKNHLATGSN